MYHADNGEGINFRPKQPATNNTNSGLIKITEPGYSGGKYYPNGYVRFYNDYEQPMNNPDVNTNPGSKNETHFEFK